MRRNCWIVPFILNVTSGQYIDFDTIHYPVVKIDRVCNDKDTLSSRRYFYNKDKTIKKVFEYSKGYHYNTYNFYYNAESQLIRKDMILALNELNLLTNIVYYNYYPDNKIREMSIYSVGKIDTTCCTFQLKYFYEDGLLKKVERNNPEPKRCQLYKYNKKNKIKKIIYYGLDNGYKRYEIEKYLYKKGKLSQIKVSYNGLKYYKFERYYYNGSVLTDVIKYMGNEYYSHKKRK